MEKKYCRLCSVLGGQHHCLFNGDGQPNQLYKLVEKYFLPMFFQVEWSKTFTYICTQCWSSLMNFYRFQETVCKAQKTLIEVNAKNIPLEEDNLSSCGPTTNSPEGDRNLSAPENAATSQFHIEQNTTNRNESDEQFNMGVSSSSSSASGSSVSHGTLHSRGDSWHPRSHMNSIDSHQNLNNSSRRKSTSFALSQSHQNSRDMYSNNSQQNLSNVYRESTSWNSQQTQLNPRERFPPPTSSPVIDGRNSWQQENLRHQGNGNTATNSPTTNSTNSFESSNNSTSNSRNSNPRETFPPTSSSTIIADRNSLQEGNLPHHGNGNTKTNSPNTNSTNAFESFNNSRNSNPQERFPPTTASPIIAVRNSLQEGNLYHESGSRTNSTNSFQPWNYPTASSRSSYGFLNRSHQEAVVGSSVQSPNITIKSEEIGQSYHGQNTPTAKQTEPLGRQNSAAINSSSIKSEDSDGSSNGQSNVLTKQQFLPLANQNSEQFNLTDIKSECHEESYPLEIPRTSQPANLHFGQRYHGENLEILDEIKSEVPEQNLTQGLATHIPPTTNSSLDNRSAMAIESGSTELSANHVNKNHQNFVTSDFGHNNSLHRNPPASMGPKADHNTTTHGFNVLAANQTSHLAPNVESSSDSHFNTEYSNSASRSFVSNQLYNKPQNFVICNSDHNITSSSNHPDTKGQAFGLGVTSNDSGVQGLPDTPSNDLNIHGSQTSGMAPNTSNANDKPRYAEYPSTALVRPQNSSNLAPNDNGIGCDNDFQIMAPNFNESQDQGCVNRHSNSAMETNSSSSKALMSGMAPNTNNANDQLRYAEYPSTAVVRPQNSSNFAPNDNGIGCDKDFQIMAPNVNKFQDQGCANRHSNLAMETSLNSSKVLTFGMAPNTSITSDKTSYAEYSTINPGNSSRLEPTENFIGCDRDSSFMALNVNMSKEQGCEVRPSNSTMEVKSRSSKDVIADPKISAAYDGCEITIPSTTAIAEVRPNLTPNANSSMDRDHCAQHSNEEGTNLTHLAPNISVTQSQHQGYETRYRKAVLDYAANGTPSSAPNINNSNNEPLESEDGDDFSSSESEWSAGEFDANNTASSGISDEEMPIEQGKRKQKSLKRMKELSQQNAQDQRLNKDKEYNTDGGICLENMAKETKATQHGIDNSDESNGKRFKSAFDFDVSDEETNRDEAEAAEGNKYFEGLVNVPQSQASLNVNVATTAYGMLDGNNGDEKPYEEKNYLQAHENIEANQFVVPNMEFQKTAYDFDISDEENNGQAVGPKKIWNPNTQVNKTDNHFDPNTKQVDASNDKNNGQRENICQEMWRPTSRNTFNPSAQQLKYPQTFGGSDEKYYGQGKETAAECRHPNRQVNIGGDQYHSSANQLRSTCKFDASAEKNSWQSNERGEQSCYTNRQVKSAYKYDVSDEENNGNVQETSQAHIPFQAPLHETAYDFDMSDESSSEGSENENEGHQLQYRPAFKYDNSDAETSATEESLNETETYSYNPQTKRRRKYSYKKHLKRPETLEQYDDLIAKWRPNLECRICNDTFARFKLLQQHFTQQHPIEECYIECCQLQLRYRYELEKHVYYHRIDRAFKCGICCAIFTTKFQLLQHLSQKHGQRLSPEVREMFKCNNCGKEYSDKFNLRNHRNYCEGVESNISRPITCPDCGKSYKTKRCLRSHQSHFHKSKLSQCPICDKIFKYPTVLKGHILSHRPERKYVCSVCHKAFKVADLMRSHFRKSHVEEYKEQRRKKLELRNTKKTYPCDQCDKVYQTWMALKEHKVQHEGITALYKCKYCDKEYKYSSNLSAHVQRVHPSKYQGKTAKEKSKLKKKKCSSKK
ncbi:uncharacterized protein [Musca autumnalis]|uniref:uncharacterized protein n=1 Tax=Musca autumnalis TaxID=221902 RepID=UPI003CFBB297